LHNKPNRMLDVYAIRPPLMPDWCPMPRNEDRENVPGPTSKCRVRSVVADKNGSFQYRCLSAQLISSLALHEYPRQRCIVDHIQLSLVAQDRLMARSRNSASTLWFVRLPVHSLQLFIAPSTICDPRTVAVHSVVRRDRGASIVRPIVDISLS